MVEVAWVEPWFVVMAVDVIWLLSRQVSSCGREGKEP